MNLPNKLTMLRVLMIPVFLVLFFVQSLPHRYLWSLIVFIAASLTDMLDGRIARKRNLVTDFGKLMDPLADKLLVMAAMLCLAADEMVHAAVVVVILAREFLVTSIRQLASGKGRVIAADRYGKLKTIFQMVWICYDLLLLWLGGSFDVGYDLAIALSLLHYILLALVLAFTVFSGYNYIRSNRDLFQGV